jgi:TonB family protein
MRPTLLNGSALVIALASFTARLPAQTTSPLMVQHVGPYVSAPAFQRGAFPDASQVASLNGPVDLEIVVAPTGRVSDVRVLRGTGGSATAESAVTAAVGGWMFVPGQRRGVDYAGQPLPGGQPETVLIWATLDFSSRDSAGKPRVAIATALPKLPPSEAAAFQADGVYAPGAPGLQFPRARRQTAVQPVPGRSVSGEVVAEIVIRADGTVGAAHVIRSVDRDADAEALAAVRTWLFAPAMLNGQAVSFRTYVSLMFTVH